MSDNVPDWYDEIQALQIELNQKVKLIYKLEELGYVLAMRLVQSKIVLDNTEQGVVDLFLRAQQVKLDIDRVAKGLANKDS